MAFLMKSHSHKTQLPILTDPLSKTQKPLPISQKMESIQALKQKQALLKLELQLIENKISFLETFGEPEERVLIEPCGETSGKSITSPELTASGKDTSNPLIADILLKDMKDVQTSTKVIITPQVMAIPELTAHGKESTNPLMVGDLPKVMNEVQTSIMLVKPSDLSLRPNYEQGIQTLKNPVSQLVMPNSSEDASVHYTNVKNYYVVFNGHKAGIYTSWKAAEQAVKGISGVKHKKYKSFTEATMAANNYRSTLGLSPLSLIGDNEVLKPSYAEAMAKEKSRMTILGSLPKMSQRISKEVPTEDFQEDDFRDLYRFAREAGEDKFTKNRFFTTDKQNLSYFNFIENCDPALVKDAYEGGLIKTIYPGHNLLEISLLPESIRTAVKTFRKKCIKDSEKNIFLKFTSTIPRWRDGEQVYAPHHHIQIGISKGVAYTPSRRMNGFIGSDDLEELAIIKIKDFISKAFNYYQGDKVFVNLSEDKVLMVSSTAKPTTKECVDGILAFQKKMLHYCFGPHHVEICKQLCKVGRESKCTSCIIVEEPQKEGHVEDSPTPSTSSS